MKRLIPGNTSAAIGGIFDDEANKVLTDANEIAGVLTKYWQTMFDAKEVDLKLLET